MPTHLLKVLFIGFTLLPILPATAKPRANHADDPLPEGARVRFGTTRPILRTGPSVDLVPPLYKTFLAPTITGGVRPYDLATGRPVVKGGSIVGPGRVVVSGDGKRAAVALPGNLSVVDIATGRMILTIQPPADIQLLGVPGASLSGNGKVLAYSGRSRDGKGWVVVWDVNKNELITEIETAQAAPIFPTLSPDGKTLVTHGPPLPAPPLEPSNSPIPMAPRPAPGMDPDTARTSQIWDVATGKELFKARVTGMGGTVVTAAFSLGGDIVALSAGDGPVDLWELKTGKHQRTILGRKGQGVRVAISPDGKIVATVGPDYRIERWTIADGKSLGVTSPPPGMLISQITGLVFADNERVIAWMTAAQFVVAWEAPSGHLLTPLTEHTAGIRSIAFPDGGKELFTSGVDGLAFRWDFPTGQLNGEIALHPARLPGQALIRPVVNLSTDGTRATWRRNPAEVFDVETGEDLFSIPPPSCPPAAVHIAVSPDGMKVVMMSAPSDNKRPGLCVVWGLATRQKIAEFDFPPSFPGTTPGAALSPDGARMIVITPTLNATGARVFTFVGYDLKTGKKLGQVEEPATGGSIYLTMANDTSAVLTSTSGKVWVLDYANGRVEGSFDNLPTRVGDVATIESGAFSPDGKLFATSVLGNQPETYGVRIYDWPHRKALHTFNGHLGPVSSLRFSPDGKFLATGSQDSSVLLWDLSKIPGRK